MGDVVYPAVATPLTLTKAFAGGLLFVASVVSGCSGASHHQRTQAEWCADSRFFAVPSPDASSGVIAEQASIIAAKYKSLALDDVASEVSPDLKILAEGYTALAVQLNQGAPIAQAAELISNDRVSKASSRLNAFKSRTCP